MKLSRKGAITLGFAFAVAIILSGVGFARAYSIQAAYDEQSQQMQLYKDALNEAQASIQENTRYKAMYECIALKKTSCKSKLMNYLNENHLASLPLHITGPEKIIMEN